MTKKYNMLINGKWIGGQKYFDVTNPCTTEIIGQCPIASSDDINAAVLSAKEAFKKTSVLPAGGQKY